MRGGLWTLDLLMAAGKWDGYCLHWPGYKSKTGYGQTRFHGRRIDVHRLAYKLYRDEKVPEGWHVMHSCDIKDCFFPGHLQIGTPRQNTHDLIRAGRFRTGHGRNRRGTFGLIGREEET